jgi:hypothetical protein
MSSDHYYWVLMDHSTFFELSLSIEGEILYFNMHILKDYFI